MNGQPFDEEAVYAVITSNANFNGMDSSYIFKEAAEANEKSTITTAVVRDVVWLYIAEALNNVMKDRTVLAIAAGSALWKVSQARWTASARSDTSQLSVRTEFSSVQ